MPSAPLPAPADGDVGFEDLLGALPDEARTRESPTTTYRRTPSDLIRFLGFAGLSAVLALTVAVARNAVLAAESDVLRALSFLTPPTVRFLNSASVVLQATVLVCAVVIVIVQRRFRLLGYLMVGNLLASAATAGVVALVDGSGATAALNEAAARSGIDVNRSLDAGALAQYVALMVILGPFVSARWRRAGALAIAGLTALRFVLSVHLPVDLLLSLTIGAAAGCAVLLAFGRPDQRPTPAAVAASLRSTALAITSMWPSTADASAWTPYVAEVEGGDRVFVKAVSPRERSADLLYRSYRFVRLRSAGDERPFSSLRRAVEHEALVSLQAHDLGVRTPRLRAIASVDPDSFVLASTLIEGTSLEDRTEPVDDATMRSCWEQVARLRSHRVAHRDLRRGKWIIDADGNPWLIDFGFSEVAASDQLLDADVAQLLVSFALDAGAERAVDAAVAVLGRDAVGASARLLQPNALTTATKRALRAHRGLLAELRDEVIARTGIEEPEYVRLDRFNAKTFLLLGMLAGATYFLLPQLGDIPGIIDQVDEADWWWFAPVVVASSVSYVGAMFGLMGSVPDRLATIPTLIAQVASSFASRLAPSAVGGMALNLRFLQKSGVDTAVGTSGIGLNAVAGILMHIVLLVTFLVWAGRSAFDDIKIPDPTIAIYGLVAVVVVTGAAFAVGSIRRAVLHRVVPVLRRSTSGLRQVLRSPSKLGLLLGGSAIVTLSYVAAMYFATLAFDGSLSLAQVGAVYLLGSAVASAAPTPGGLGALEAAVIAGLVAAGMPNTIAVPSVFLFRLGTFWLPVLPGWGAFVYLKRAQYL